jgi:ribosomal protein S18 acetylase RimI-like enzyme
MPAIEIRPFESPHLDAASRLLAERHTAERQELTFLSARFEQPANVTKAISALLNKPHAQGFVAIENGEVTGYVIGTVLLTGIMARSGWLHAAGHAVQRSDLYHDLYTALSDHWVQRGVFDHYITVSAANTAALEAWFSLSFGKQQAYGVAFLHDFLPQPAPLNDIEIRQARPEDRESVYQMGANNVTYQTHAPVFAAVPPEYIVDVQDGYVETLENPEEGTIWLAVRGDELLGYHVYAPHEDENTNLLSVEHAIDLPAAGTLPASRGLGIGTHLTQHCFQHYKSEGYRYIVTDWRTTNLLSARFWPKMGFRPMAYRLARSVDPRVAWGKA